MKMALPKQLSATLRMECSAYGYTHSLVQLRCFIHIHVVKQHLLAFCKPQQLGWRPGTKLCRNVLFLVDSVKIVQVFPLILRGEKSVGMHSQRVTF